MALDSARRTSHTPPQNCKGCKQTKPSSEFYRNRTNADGLFGKCKLCSDKQA